MDYFCDTEKQGEENCGRLRQHGSIFEVGESGFDEPDAINVEGVDGLEDVGPIGVEATEFGERGFGMERDAAAGLGCGGDGSKLHGLQTRGFGLYVNAKGERGEVILHRGFSLLKLIEPRDQRTNEHEAIGIGRMKPPSAGAEAIFRAGARRL